MLEDIAHGLPQYVSRQECPIGSMPWGGMCERVNLSDWEGKGGVGGNIFASCSWCEVGALLTVTQIPSIYVQTDRQEVTVFDHLKVEKMRSSDGRMTLKVTNPTVYPAEVKIYSETSKEARKTLMPTDVVGMQSLYLNPGETKEVNI